MLIYLALKSIFPLKMSFSSFFDLPISSIGETPVFEIKECKEKGCVDVYSGWNELALGEVNDS